MCVCMCIYIYTYTCRRTRTTRMYCDISIVRCSALEKERTISRLLRKNIQGWVLPGHMDSKGGNFQALASYRSLFFPCVATTSTAIFRAWRFPHFHVMANWQDIQVDKMIADLTSIRVVGKLFLLPRPFSYQFPHRALPKCQKLMVKTY